ncbi:hypothetical protein ELI_14680 [Erythrobacter litoralis HTCC2594]|uniref:Uncharacterized protein n=1 Tax=Erythrobacter litoralis (strain HTCC2594) TaxID=314225 RepID=Q2N5L3_ERYLH|nr:hypothetical protein ELI_14680 [Erythrobacter litoralis HTCC2594]
MDGVDHTRCEMRWQCVIVTLVESEISKLIILDDMLIEEAVQRPLFCGFQSFEIAARR